MRIFCHHWERGIRPKPPIWHHVRHFAAAYGNAESLEVNPLIVITNILHFSDHVFISRAFRAHLTGLRSKPCARKWMTSGCLTIRCNLRNKLTTAVIGCASYERMMGAPVTEMQYLVCSTARDVPGGRCSSERDMEKPAECSTSSESPTAPCCRSGTQYVHRFQSLGGLMRG